jgi:putative endopeptidase
MRSKSLISSLAIAAALLTTPMMAMPVFAEAPAAAAPESTVAKTYGAWGFDMAGMDKSIKPGDDFFDYANGTALKNMVIPGDQPGYGSFNALYDLSELRLKALVTGLAALTDLTGEDLKIADL